MKAVAIHHSSCVFYWGALTGAVMQTHTLSGRFKEGIDQSFYDGIGHKPHTTFGNIKAEVLADKDPHLTPANFCSVIRGSAWCA